MPGDGQGPGGGSRTATSSPTCRRPEAEGLRVTHVTETHIHADFVSGARELARRAGARLLLSDAGDNDWRYRYAAEDGADRSWPTATGSGWARSSLPPMHTPGHTPEHLTFLVTDTAVASEPMGALTGDFVFVGDVGRPDLLERAAQAAGTMRTSARTALPLAPAVRRAAGLPPALAGTWRGLGLRQGARRGAAVHAGLRAPVQLGVRACGTKTSSCATVLAGQPDPPPYFAEMKRINRDGPRALGGSARRRRGSRPRPWTRRWPPARRWWTPGRRATSLCSALPGTINIPANRSFTTWAGWLLPYDGTST